MPLNRKKFYIFFSFLWSAGCIWLITNIIEGFNHNPAISICIFKRITNIPCPSCGSTRAVLFLLKGNLKESILTNPIGIILTIIVIILPVWILFDLIRRKDTIWQFYQNMEITLRKRYIAIFCITLILLNWIWNIYKGL